MKNISIILLSVITIIISSVLVQSCVSTKLAERGGAQLWGENCVRCHSTPPPNAFSSEQWETIGMHMRVRAGITDSEIKRITEFIISAN